MTTRFLDVVTLERLWKFILVCQLNKVHSITMSKQLFLKLASWYPKPINKTFGIIKRRKANIYTERRN